MKITKREIIASIAIIAIMLFIGVLISGKISEAMMDTHEKYYKATKLESSELFRYGMDTSIGNAFIYGDLQAIDDVTYPEIGGKYLSVTKIKERYTKHTRTVTKEVNGKKYTDTEEYWTWDEVDRDSLKASKVIFCGIEFYYSQFDEQDEKYIDTIQKSLFSDIRYVYYGCPAQLTGTAFACLIDKNISKDGAMFYKNMTIENTVKHLTSGAGLIVFWIFWIILIAVLTYLFYKFENRWLEEGKHYEKNL